jgi:hypothetical protein
MSDVWAVFHRAQRPGGDVAVAATRSAEPVEWKEAHHKALRNMHDCQREAQRWGLIADELRDGYHRALAGEQPTQGEGEQP